MPTTRRRRIWHKRLTSILFTTVVTLLLIEVILQVAALFFGGRSGPVGGEGAEVTVLTLGDSHTYGVHLPEEESYPGRLRQNLEERAPGRFRVVNLGLPGTNSSQIVARLPEWIDKHSASVVIVCVGVNNFWNQADLDAGPGAEEGFFTRWLGKSRIVRFARLLLYSRNVDIVEVNARPVLDTALLAGDTEGVEHRDMETGEVLIRHEGVAKKRQGSDAEVYARFRRDLSSMLTVTERRDVRLILLTYSSVTGAGSTRRYRTVEALNAQYRDFAAAHDVTLVDAEPRFKTLLADGSPRTTYFLTMTDGHPNAAGYVEIAELVANVLVPE